MMLAMLSVIPHILEGLLLAEILAPLGPHRFLPADFSYSLNHPVTAGAMLV